MSATITPPQVFSVWYEHDPVRSPGYKRMIEVKCAPDRKSHFGLEVLSVREHTLLGWEDAPHLLEDMQYRPLSWTKVYHELRELMRGTNAD